MKHRIFFRTSCTAISLLLTGCYGPLGTCRTQCKAPEVRDAFCGCYKPTPPNSGGGNGNNPAPPSYGAPYLNFTWADSPSCGTLNRAYYVFNPTPNNIEVWVSNKERSGARTGGWIPASKNTVTFESASFIGLEGLEPDCFDQDFQMGTWRDTKTKIDGYAKYLAEVNGVSVESLQQVNNYRLFQRKTVALDCKQLCSTNPPSPACLSLSPGDAAIADKARDAVYTGAKNGNIDWNVALSPIIGNSPECKRSETVKINDRIISQGEACAYPFLAKATDTKPSVVVHIPYRMSASVANAGLNGDVSSRSISEAPYVAFKNRTVTDEYGGYVQSVTADDKSIYYQTSAPACLMISTR